MNSLISHLESHLGKIEGGWSETISGAKLPIMIVRFLNQPVAGAATYLTLGLSNEVCSLSDSKQVRQELLFAAHRKFEKKNIAGVVEAIAQQILTSKKALLRGQVLGPAGPLFNGLELEALYCAIPVYYPDSFAVYSGSLPPTVFVWLIPLFKSEAEYIESNGWSAFEDIVETANPDLLNLERDAII